jgi:putative phosphoesterase
LIIGIISDTHGSIHGWESALQVFQRERAELILHCGDILDINARASSPLVRALNSSPIPVLAVRGNMDAPNHITLLQFPVVPLALVQDGTHRIVVVHGNLLTDAASAFRQAAYLEAHFLVRGHTHIPDIQTKGGVYLLNPGSAGSPRGSSQSSAMILTPKTVRLITLHSGETIQEASVN